VSFQEYAYERPDIDVLERDFQALVARFAASSSVEEQNAVLADITNLRNHWSTMETLAHVRYSIDTRDAFYKQEQDFFDEIEPRWQGLTTELYQAIVGSPFRAELEQQWGKQFFTIAELTLKTFSPDVIADLQRENALASEYSKLLASAQIAFEGEERNLSQLGPFETSTDRDMRKRASTAKWNFYADHAEELDRIYDELVRTRTEIARKLGFKDFVELAYARMSRSDYDREMVQNFRKQVRELIVPVVTKLHERQRARIGVDVLRYYDESFNYTSGNPKPQGDPDWIIAQGKQMYHELSAETDEFFTFMLDNQLLDLVAKKGKQVGGYCTIIPDYKAPFIFSNFNGTLGDVTVLTHEAGHAFQTYSSRHFSVPEYAFPTMEAAEIHSMSMEFLTWPWMDLFFQADTDKFKFMHLSESLSFIPYGVAVDEFQHFVYENPSATPAERKQAWRRIEQTYLPHRDYEGNEFLENGGFWQKQTHIYSSPFYYIDYTLAQICAFQFWTKAQADRQSAWRDYLRLCQLGGSQSFLALLKEGNLISPFEDGCVASVIGQIEAWLAQIDDTAL
jgi:M3 family oligoendopeptidase